MTDSHFPIRKGATALVTGGTGFIGSNLVCRLDSEGWAVHVLARPQSSTSLINDVSERVVVHRHGGSADRLVDLMRHVSPDIVFHLATYYHASHEPSDIEPMLGATVVFATELVDAMAWNGVYRLINSGTAAQHYMGKPYSPAWLHAAAKQSFEDILQYYVETTPLRATTLKLHDNYGPTDPRPKLFTLLRGAVETGESLDMSPGEQLLNLTHIDDVVDAYVVAARRLLADEPTETGCHECFAVTAEELVTLREVAKVYGEVLGRPVPINWGGRAYRPREIMRPTDVAPTLPGWRPRIPLREGLASMEASRT